jgi:uncharacterized NAD(P)/FAD-binding protein YdhS
MESLLYARERIDRFARLDVTVFDPSPHPWCGRTYAPDVDAVLTNINTARMSTREWDPAHVNEWFNANGHGALTGSSYCPRAVMGAYYCDAAAQAAARMDGFALVPEQVVDVALRDERTIVTTPQRVEEFDYVVLCMGGAKAHDPYHLAGHDGFVSDPYPLAETLGEIDPDERVAILGAGLTAVDVTIGLRDHGHRGPITLLSRRGLLPAPRPPFVDYTLQRFTLERFQQIVAVQGQLRLDHLVALMLEEMARAGVSKESLIEEVRPSLTGLDRLRSQLARLHRGDNAYTIAVKTSVTACEDAWWFLPTEDKRLVASQFRHVAYSLCCPMPEYRAVELLQLGDAGQLTAVSGLRSVAADADGQFVAQAEGVAPMRFDRVISAISAADRITPLAAPVVERLASNGAAQAHPLGGLDVDHATSRLLAPSGRPQPRLYGLGGVVGGSLYFFNGHVFARPRTIDVAKAIVTHQAVPTTSLLENDEANNGRSSLASAT